MESNQEFEKYIKDSLSNLDKEPRTEVWDKIETTLNSKKKRRIVPFIFFSLGVAVLVLFYVGYQFYDDETSKTGLDSNTALDSLQLNLLKYKNNSVSNNENNTFQIDSLSDENATIDINYSTSTDLYQSNVVVQNDDTSSIKINGSNTKKTIHSGVRTNNNVQSESNNLLNNSNKNTSRITSDKDTKELMVSDKYNQDFDSLDYKNSTSGNEIKIEDSLTATLLAELDIQIKEKEEEKTKDSSVDEKRNWSISVFAAPTFFGSVSNNSILDKNTDKNNDSSKMMWSYGGYFNIDSTDKLGMRLGLVHSKVEVTTAAIPIYQPSNEVTLFNQFSNLKLNNGISNQDIADNFPNEQEINMVTSLTFNEFLFDVRYRLYESKFTVDGFGGFGFVMISQNQVKAVGALNNSLKIGSLSSFDSLIFSANLGVLSSYPITKNTKVFINPSFGYQFTELKSYSFMIKSGMTFYFN
ncbi:MAG: hypothetical protein Q8K02_16385 [Flavobacterium sp.]|nr:hypothetical protein [Flavobacterium sp.]